MQGKACRALLLFVVWASVLSSWTMEARAEASKEALGVVKRAIDAMGGDAYLNVKATESHGRYFQFRNRRKSFTRFSDWTVYRPAKWRFQLGEGKRQFVQIYNLETEKGWVVEGKSTPEEVKPEDIEDFKKTVSLDIDFILRYRLEEEGMNLYYYGPDEISGTREYEAVEFLDATNNSVVLYLDRSTGLPHKLESHFTDKVGVRHKQEQEFSNWHAIQGVKAPLRYDVYIDEEVSSQRFLEELKINPEIPPNHFDRPVVEAK